MHTRSQAASATRFVEPHAMDILSGRGKKYYNRPGNKRMREIIGRYQPLYQEARTSKDPHDPRRAKAFRNALKEILQPTEGVQPRFLKLDSSKKRWVLLDDSAIREKVKHRLRERPRVTKNRNSTSASRDRESRSPRDPSSNPTSANGEYSDKRNDGVDHGEDVSLFMPLDPNEVNVEELDEFFIEDECHDALSSQ